MSCPKALAALRAHAVAQKHIFPERNLKDDTAAGPCEVEAEKQLQRFAVTRCESRLCAAFIAGGSNLKRRISDYTSECTSEIKADWSNQVHPSLVKMCELATNNAAGSESAGLG